MRRWRPSLLVQAHLRELWRERSQHLLALLGVALGVAVVVAVDLVNASSREAMRRAEVEVTGPVRARVVALQGIEDGQIADLRRRWRAGEGPLSGARALVPVVEGPAELISTAARLRVRLRGPDLVAALGSDGTASWAQSLDPMRLLTEPGALMLDARTAGVLGLEAGDALQVASAAGFGAARLVQILKTSASGSPTVVVDIATAQELLGREGVVDHVDVLGWNEDASSAHGGALERVFPGLVVRRTDPMIAPLEPPLRLESVSAQRDEMRALASAFQLNLAAMGLLALAVGLFLIHGSMRQSLHRRLDRFSRLRALGVQGGELRAVLLIEVLVLGTLGALVGLALGRVLAGGLLGLVSTTLEGLYAHVAIAALAPDPVPYVKGLCVGVVGCVGAGLPLARHAARVAPLASMGTSETGGEGSAAAGPALRSSGALVLIACVGLLPSLGYFGGLWFIAGVLLGAACLVPTIMHALLSMLARWVRPLRLRALVGDSVAGLRESGVASAALVVAVATALGMGIMVESFRGSVQQWLGERLAAPLYLQLPQGTQPETRARVQQLLERHADHRLERRILQERVERTDVSETRRLPSTLVWLEVHGEGPAPLAPVMISGGWDGAGALISEATARGLGLDPAAVDSPARLRIAGTLAAVPVAGVFREYGGGRGTVVLPMGGSVPPPEVQHATVVHELFAVHDVPALQQALDAHLPPGVATIRNAELLEASLAVFDRTFRVTSVLQTLAGLIAAAGLLAALSTLALERRRQHAVLRAVGAPRRLPALQSVAESVALAGLAAVLAMPLGAGVAWILVHVVNVRAFGWSIDLVLPPGQFLLAFVIAVLAGVLAAVLPAGRLLRMNPVDLLRGAHG